MKQPITIHPVVRYYLRHVRSYPKLLAGTLIAVPLTVLVNNYLPALIAANILSRLAQNQYRPGQVWESFGPSLLAYAALLLLGVLIWRIVDYFVWRLEANTQKDMANEVFRHMLRESADFHANNFTGSLVSRSTKLLSGYVRTADTTIFQAYPMLAGIVIVSVILLPRAPLYVLILLTFSALYISFALFISRPVRRKGAEVAAAESKQTGLLADAMTNVMAIKSFARSRYEQQRFEEATEDTRSSMMRLSRVHKLQMNTLGTLGRTISSLALIVAVISVMVYGADIGTVFLILSYTASIVDQLFNFANNGLRNYSRSIGDAAEMVETLSQTPAILDPVKPEPVRIHKGEVHFDRISFTHAGSDDAIFKDLDLLIRPGEKVGLVGHSGSGKSTLVRLLMRFSDIDKGAIRLDGQSIAAITQDDLHGKIAYVPQEPLLFHRSIRDNVAYGRPGVDEKTIRQAAERANAAEFIDSLPQGYETLVGERGVKLSGGQRQRVAIARAMLKDAPVLILDEATSALDSESEVLIQQALWKLMEGRTAIVIAHRLSTIQKMDRIIVLDSGRIVEQGSHQELIRAGGTYAKLWSHQSGGFIEE